MHKIWIILNDFQLLFLINLHYPLVNQVFFCFNATGSFICRTNQWTSDMFLGHTLPTSKGNVVEDLSIQLFIYQFEKEHFIIMKYIDLFVFVRHITPSLRYLRKVTGCYILSSLFYCQIMRNFTCHWFENTKSIRCSNQTFQF